MNNELLINEITRLAKLKNEFPTNACINAGVGRSFISDLRKGQVPSVAKIQQLSEYLGVTTSELLGEEKPPESEDNGRFTPGVSEETRVAMELLSRLNPENYDKAMDYLQYQLAKQEEAEDKK